MRLLSLLILLCIPTALFAQEKPPSLMSVVGRRLALNAIARYDMAYAGDKADPTLTPGKEFAAGIAATYLLGPALEIEAGSLAAVDTKQVRSWVQVNFPFFGAQRQPIQPTPRY